MYGNGLHRRSRVKGHNEGGVMSLLHRTSRSCDVSFLRNGRRCRCGCRRWRWRGSGTRAWRRCGTCGACNLALETNAEQAPCGLDHLDGWSTSGNIKSVEDLVIEAAGPKGRTVWVKVERKKATYTCNSIILDDIAATIQPFTVAVISNNESASAIKGREKAKGEGTA